MWRHVNVTRQTLNVARNLLIIIATISYIAIYGISCSCTRVDLGDVKNKLKTEVVMCAGLFIFSYAPWSGGEQVSIITSDLSRACVHTSHQRRKFAPSSLTKGARVRADLWTAFPFTLAQWIGEDKTLYSILIELWRFTRYASCVRTRKPRFCR